MSLKYEMDNLEGVDQAIASLYEEKGDKFVLSGIQGVTSKSKLDEFRENNIGLSRKLETFEGIDPDKVKETEASLADALIKLENASATDEETLNKLVENRVATIAKESEDLKARLEGTISSQSQQLEKLIVGSATTAASVEHNVLSTAIVDVQNRVAQVFRLEGTKPVAYNSEGQKMYGDDGITELTIGDFVQGLLKTDPHLFTPSKTSGIRRSGGAFGGDSTKLSPVGKIQAALG